jgi:epoxide hydrolase-like predicted phosphatase
MIKAIIFDFFEVIVFDGLRPYIDTYFVDKPDKKIQAIKLVDDRSKGIRIISRDIFIDELAKLAGTTTEVAEDYLSNRHLNIPLLRFIRSELKPHYKIGLLSNASDDWAHKLLAPEDVELFDEILMSYKHKMIKPELRFYKLMTDRLGVEPAECVFVDDIKKYCDGAEAVGMQAIEFVSLEDLKKQLSKIITG